MNSIVYKSLILSNILQLEQFGKELDNWLHENFSNKEGLFIAHTLISTGMQIDCGDIDINKIKKYFECLSEKYCSQNHAKFISASMFASYVTRCKECIGNFECSNRNIELWEDAINKFVPSGEYSDIDYIYDLACINFLHSCYSNIANYTNKVRDISMSIIANKDKFEEFELKYRNIPNS